MTSRQNPEIQVAQAVGIGELTYFTRVHYGGGAACATGAATSAVSTRARHLPTPEGSRKNPAAKVACAAR